MKPLFEDAKIAKTVDAPVATPVVADPLGSSFSQLVPVSANAQALESVPASSQSMQIMRPRVTEDQIADIGADAAGALKEVSTKLLAHTRSSDAGDFGKGLNQLVVLAKGLNPDDLKDRGFLGKLRGMVAMTKERLMGQFASVDRQLTTLTSELDGKALLHKQRISDMETLYNNNVEYHNRLEAAVANCEALLASTSADYAREQTKPIGDSFGAQVLADYQRLIAHIEKRIDDLKRAMLLSKQMAPQIRMMQDNARALVSKFASVKTVTLPAWQNAFQLYILQMEQTQAVEILNAVDDATDDALRKSADKLRQNTAAIAEARNRSVVGIDTLVHVQSQLIASVEDVKRIDTEGRERRQKEQTQLIAMEQELIQKFAPGQR